MKGKFLKITIACMLLVTLTAINFISVGMGLASYAVDNITAKTNHENVAFSAYFKNEAGEKVSDTKVDINSQEIKLYLNIEVAKEGYFNGQIKLTDSNFEFVSSQNEYVNNVTGDTINLNQINAGSNPEIEITVKPKVAGNFNLDLLDMESKMSLTGIYKDSTEKDINISGETKVQMAYVSINAQENVESSIDVLTNKLGMYNGEEKRIVQVLVKAGMKNGSYPMKHITSKVNVPEVNGEKPTLESKVTLKGMSKYNMKNENNIVTVDIENEPDSENKVIWSKDGSEEIILTYIFDKKTDVKNTDITANNEITLYDGNTIKTEAVKTTVNEEKDGIITLNEKIDNAIYKGKIYAGIDKEFVSGTEIQVNLDKVAETIYVNENPTSIPSEYVRSTINKKDMLNLLGENGKVEITAGKENFTLTKSNEADENGNFVVNYPQGVNSVTIRTTNPQKAGNLKIAHVKTIRGTNKAIVKNATQMETVLNGTYETRSTQKGTIPETVAVTQLNETTTVAKLEVNRESLSTITENKNVEIKATLLSNNEQYDLYKNPVIEIELPQDVVNAKVNSINKVYGDEFTAIKPSQAVINGRQVIRIQLEGTQETYKEPGIEGTQILMDADLTLNNKATSKQDTIKMTYANANANQYKDGANVGTEVVNMEVVSPKGLITTNNMNALGVQTIADQEKVTTNLDKNVEAKTVKVEEEIINNNEASINNVAVLGNFGVDGESNNLHIGLLSGLAIEGIDTSKVKVYYTENEAATIDISNSENAWSETATTSAKKYLVTASDMQVAEGMKISYDIQIPAGLDYNQKAEQGYKVTYTESNTGITQELVATTIELTTGTGPAIEARLSAKLGSSNLKENEKVKQGEIITYKTEVKNTGTEVAKDVKVIAQVPSGVQVIENNEQTIPEVQPGETKAVEYKAQISKELKEDSEIKTKSSVIYEDVSKETNEITNTVAEGNISIQVQHDDNYNDNAEMVAGGFTPYMATITNLTDTEQKNLKFTWQLPDEIEISQQYTATEETYKKMLLAEDYFSDEGYKEQKLDKEITIDSLPANSSLIVYITAQSKQTKEAEKDFAVSAKIKVGNKEYTSNEAYGKIISANQYTMEMSSRNENEYVKPGDVIEYNLKVKNKNNMAIDQAIITDEISKNLTITNMTVNGEIAGENVNNEVKIPIDMGPGEEKNIKIETIVNKKEGMLQDEEITNKATMYALSEEYTSNAVSHKMIANQSEEEYKDENGNLVYTYKISGNVWEDQSANGARDDSEQPIEGIDVKLLNIATNELAKNPKGETITATTGKDGNYTLSGIPTGQYITVFGYDASIYRLTDYEKEGIDSSRNSNVVARKLSIDGQEKTYAVTDIIEITESSKANVNMGLVKSEKFDMKLNKYISKVVVQTASGTETYNYNDESLAKVEIKAKEVQGANVVIEYKIKVTNSGELEGYIKNIVDYLPKDLTFTSELNKDWYQEGSNIYNNSLSNRKLAPGESKEVILKVTKKMTEENTGLMNNLAEIKEDYNEAGMTDINSTPGNKKQGENDMGSADVIISVRTGGPILYTTFTIIILAVIAIGIYFVKRETKPKKDEII